MAKISNLDFYAILGVHPNAEDIVIRAAFKALAQRYHPDRFAGSKDEAHRRMADLTNAYETLADPARRRKYDRRRGLTARRATFYFKNPARDRQPFGALAARAAARKARHYRVAVYVLMVAVVILSGFNVHQHSAQIKELFAWNRSASGPITEAMPGGAATAPAPATETASPSAPAPATTANVRILPIGQGTTRPIVTPEPQAPAARAPEAAVAVPPPVLPSVTKAPEPVAVPPPALPSVTKASEPAVAVPSPAPADVTTVPAPIAPEPAVTVPPPAPAPAAVAKTPAPPAVTEAQKATAAASTGSSGADATRKETKRATPKSVVAKAVEPDRPAATPKPVVAKTVEPDRPAAPPAAAQSDRCAPELVALGLCNRNSTAKGQ